MSTLAFDNWQSPDGVLSDVPGYFYNNHTSRWSGDPSTGANVVIRESNNVSSITDNGTGIWHHALLAGHDSVGEATGHGTGSDTTNRRHVGPEEVNGGSTNATTFGWESRNTSSTITDCDNSRVWTTGRLA